ncbi:hypothetical protein IWX81_002880 [Salinibacterium sp. CAN_S4]
MERFLLVRREQRVDRGFCLLPAHVARVSVRGERLQRLRVDLEGTEFAHVMAEDRKQLGIHESCLLPMLFVPRLELDDFWALKAHIEFHVLSQARAGEIRRSDERSRADDAMPAVRDVRLGVELPRLVDANLDLSASDSINNSIDASEEGVTLLALDLNRVVERGRDSIGGRAARLTADQEPYAIHFLPGSIEREERADLEMARSDIN